MGSRLRVIVSLILVAAAGGVTKLLAEDPAQPTAAIHQAHASADNDGPPPIVEESPRLMQRGLWQRRTRLDLPPAPLDFKPSLEVVNDHNAVGGVLGNGWLLGGLSKIERKGPTRGAPTMTDDDTFWLDGQQLHPVDVQVGVATEVDPSARRKVGEIGRPEVGQPVFSALPTYRLERDDNRVFRYDEANDVWTAQLLGRHWRYGTLDGDGGAATEWQTSSLDDHCGGSDPWSGQQNATTWHLAETRDAFDNTLSYEYSLLCECPDDNPLYDRFEGEAACAPVLSEIRYGAARVALTYAERPDPQARAEGGRLRFLAHRLSEISAFVDTGGGEELYSSYALRYTATRLFLPLEPIERVASASGVTASVAKEIFLDSVDGENTAFRRLDRVGAGGEERTLLSAESDLDATSFGSAISLSGFDGIPDYFSSTPISVNFDGDGYPDLAVLSMHCAGSGLVDCETDIRGYHNNDDGTFGFEEDDVLTELLQEALPTEMVIWGAYLFADVDGDGRTELHVSRNTSDPDVQSGASYLLRSKNKNHKVETGLIDLEEDELRGAQMADVDGDGLLDMVYGAAALHAGFPTQEMIPWRRNKGSEPYFESGLEYIPHPIAEDEELSNELDGLLTRMWIDCRDELGDDVTSFPWENLDWGTNGLPEYAGPEDFWLGNSRLGDFNGDGIVDVAFSFAVCWEEGDEPTDLEPTDYVFSRVYYGDGLGNLHDAGFGLGTPFLQANSTVAVDRPDASPWSGRFLDNWSSFAVTDLNGDRVPEVVYRRDGERRLRAAHFRGLDDGYGFEASVTETTELPLGVKAISTRANGEEAIFAQTTAIDDWDGDGLSDLLVMEREPRSDSASDLEVKIFPNERATPQHLTTGLVNEWGGTTEISYASTNEAGENPDLPFAVRVVESVRDHRGLSRFSYSGAAYEERQFLGFAEVEGEYESGLLFEATFSLSPAFRGSLVTRAERRRDGSLERFLYNDYIERDPMYSSYDLTPPYFNPVRRSCRFEVGKSFRIPQTGTGDLEADLIAECLEFAPEEGRPWEVRPVEDDFILHGWHVSELDRPPVLTKPPPPTKPLAQEGPGIAGGKPGQVTGPGVPGIRAERPSWLHDRKLTTRREVEAHVNPLVTARKSRAQLDPGFVERPDLEPEPLTVPARRMFVRDYDYGTNQRRTEERNYRLASEEGDDLRTEYEYAPMPVLTGQAELTAIRYLDDRDRQYRRYDFDDPAAFEAPREVAETGQLGEVRTRSREFDVHGQMTLEQTVVDAGGRTEDVVSEYDACGLPTRITDPVGRERSSERDSACRESEVGYEGGHRSYSRDGFGRVTSIRVDNGVSPVQETLHYYVDEAVDPEEPHRAYLRGNQLTRVFLDEWGRKTESEVCQLAGDAPPAGTRADELECVSGTSIRELWGYAADGSLRYHTRPHADGETPATVWTYKDERWRIIEQQLPSHDYVGAGPALFDLTEPSSTIVFTRSYGLGSETTTGPDGTSCKRTFDTLEAELTCAGVFRGSSRFDARGNLVETVDASGVVTEYEHDDFQRLSSATPKVTIATCDGEVTNPTVSYAWDYVGNQLSKTEADGVVHEWSYDLARRPLEHSIVPADGSPEIVLNAWRYVDGPPERDPDSPAGRAVEELDPSGSLTTRYLDGFGWTYASKTPAGDLALRRRDGMGRVVLSVDIDRLRTHYSYDVHDRMVSEHVNVARGDRVYCPGRRGTGRCRIASEYEYDGAGRVTAFVDADGVRREYGYTESGRLAFATLGDWLLSAARYDDYGNPTWTWRDGVESELGYDDLWRLTSECRGVHAGGCEQEIEFTYDAEDRIASRTVGGATTMYERDYRGRVVTEIHPDGEERSFVYGLTTGVCRETDEDGFVTTLGYDALGRLTSWKPHERLAARQIEYELGIPGSTLGLDTLLSRSRTTEPDGSVWDSYYDFAHREVGLVRPDGSTLLTVYEGSLATETRLLDGTGAVQEMVATGYDALSRRLWFWGPVSEATWNARGGRPERTDYVHLTRHTPAGRLARVDGPVVDRATGRRSSTTVLTYDDAGLPIEEDVVGLTRIAMGYDVDHGFPRPKTRTVGAGTADPRVSTLSYSEGGLSIASLVTEGPRSGGAGDREILEHLFGDFDRYGAAQLEEAWSTLGASRSLKTRYRSSHDLMGRPEWVEVELGDGRSGRVDYRYFGDGLVEEVVTSWAGGLRLSRGGRGNVRVIEAVDAGGATLGELARVARRDPMQRPIEIALSNGASVERRYDALGRLEWQKATSPTSETDEREYTYDSRGLLAGVVLTTAAGTRTDSWTYTEEGWLSEESSRRGSEPPSVTTFDYDAGGNRIGRTMNGDVVRYRYGAVPSYGTARAGSALLGTRSSAGVRRQEWDAFGGVTRDVHGFEIERDALGRVASIWDEDGYERATFLRDHTGRPVMLSSNAGDRLHFWGNPLSTVYPLATLDESGVASVYAAFGHDLVGRLVGSSLEDALTDLRGNLVLSDGELLELLGAFGEEVATPVSGLAFVFGGQEFVTDTPYLSAQQRLYDPEIGRFASADPLGFEGGSNRFLYAGNDPLRMIDPWGTTAEDVAAEAEDFEPIDEDERDILATGNLPIERLVRALPADDPRLAFCNGTCPEDGIHKFEPVSVTALPLPGEVPVDGPGLPGEGAPQTEAEPTARETTPEPAADPAGPDPAGDAGIEETVEGPTTTPTEEPSPDTPAPSENGPKAPPLPENFNGTAEDLNGLLNDGYTIDSNNGLLTTPGGNYVIPGVNDAQNPMPHKVLVNMAGDAVDDIANGGVVGALAQAAGLWEGNGNPGADIVNWLGMGYTASEKPREAVAETAMTVVLTAGGSVAGAGAASAGRSMLARGCAGPLGRLPGAIRRASGITCFAEGTPVVTDEGLVPIEEIEVGDRVLCRSDQTDETKMCEVEHLFEARNRSLLELTIEDEDGRAEIFTTTPNHRFFVTGHGWKEAADLEPGDLVTSADGDVLRVASSQPVTGESTVYNFEVEDFETYFVGESGVWVHNQGRTCPGHRATAKLFEILEDGKERLVETRNLVSGETTEEIANALTPGNARMAVHTETKYLREVYRRIVSGNLSAPKYRVEFLGELAPCSRCQGAMNGMDFMVDVQSTYRWGDARNIWQSINERPPSRSFWNNWFFDTANIKK